MPHPALHTSPASGRRFAPSQARWLPCILAAWTALVATAPHAAEPAATATPLLQAHYRLLEQALPRYQALAARPGLTSLPALPRRSIKPGEDWEGAPALRQLLVALGDLDAAAATPPMAPSAPEAKPAAAAAAATGATTATPARDPALLFDTTLSGGLQRFQERHGLDPDGVLGPASWRALTTPLAARVRQIERTLEHWRALPPNPHRRAIFINIPRFRLYAVSGSDVSESQMLRIDVVVGRAVKDLRTPVFTADMTHVIFRPYWDVPRSIARKEILPAIARDSTYLERNHFELVDGGGRVVATTPASIAQLAAGTLRVRQRPGDDNALGGVKFMLPNPHNVYLHDTPARTLFARSRRDFSHGCIRVADPAALARWVLQGDPSWTPERIAEAMQGEAPLQVDLAEPVRVYIVYGTAVAREDGSMLFLEDVYRLEKD